MKTLLTAVLILAVLGVSPCFARGHGSSTGKHSTGGHGSRGSGHGTRGGGIHGVKIGHVKARLSQKVII